MKLHKPILMTSLISSELHFICHLYIECILEDTFVEIHMLCECFINQRCFMELVKTFSFRINTLLQRKFV